MVSCFVPGRAPRSTRNRCAPRLIDLLDLGSREGDVVKSQVIHLSRGVFLCASSGEQVEGVIAERVGVRGGVKVFRGSLQHAIDVKRDDAGTGLALVVNHREVVPDAGRGLRVTVQGVPHVTIHTRHHGSRGGAVDTIVRKEAEARGTAVEIRAVFKQRVPSGRGVGTIHPGGPCNCLGGAEIDAGILTY